MKKMTALKKFAASALAVFTAFSTLSIRAFAVTDEPEEDSGYYIDDSDLQNDDTDYEYDRAFSTPHYSEAMFRGDWTDYESEYYMY